MKTLVSAPNAQSVNSPMCPVCRSTQRYWRQRKGEYVCRVCGSTYDYRGKLLLISLPGQQITTYKVAVISEGRGKNTGKRG